MNQKRLIRLFQIWNRTCCVSVTVTALSFRHSHNPVTLMELQSSAASGYCAGDLTTLTVHTVNNAWGYVFIFLTLAAIFLGLHRYLEMCHPLCYGYKSMHKKLLNKKSGNRSTLMKCKAQLSDMNMKPFVISPQCCVAPYQGAFNLSSVRRPDRSNLSNFSRCIRFSSLCHNSPYLNVL